jgi:isoquinoline 1-oxidoreductase beta subunit
MTTKSNGTLSNRRTTAARREAPTAPARRDFLKTIAAAGGALCLELALPPLAHAQGGGAEVTVWLLVYPDNTVLMRVARSEMGQGSMTGLPMLIAEELECDWNAVRVEYVPVAEHIRRDRAWGSMSTGGSMSIRGSHSYLRSAGAAAREMLIAAAAQQWNVDPASCRAANSVITHIASNRQLTYGQVAEAASRLTLPKDLKLKEPKDWTLIGKPVKRLDLRDKVLGKPVFAIDVQLPGMLHASLAQCPVFGGKLKSVGNREAVLKRRGVRNIVELPDAVAVVADNWWRADQALQQLRPEWDDGGNGKATSDSIRAFLMAGIAEVHVPVARNDGDAVTVIARATRRVEAEYYTPLLNHATMEPQTCTAVVKGERVEVWAATQNGEATAAAAAATAGVPLANVEVHKMQLGGGFGRRGFQDAPRYAVLVARQMPGTPVKTTWSRAEDMQHCFFRPVSVARMSAGLDDKGRLLGWRTRIAAPSITAGFAPDRMKNGLDLQACSCFADSPYAVPNMRVEYAMRNTHVPVGYWRSVYHSQNPYFRECFLDEVAAAAGKDPYALRRELLAGEKEARNLRVLEAAAKAADWTAKAPAGVFRGIAVADGYGSYAASVVELSIEKDMLISLKRVIVAVDPGHVVNPDSARAQIEGNVIFALTAALYGEITIKDGRVEQNNFDDYRMMLLRECPKIESVLAPSGGFWGGMGEPPLMPVTPALVNAIAAATGKRIRSLPLARHGFKLAAAA